MAWLIILIAVLADLAERGLNLEMLKTAVVLYIIVTVILYRFGGSRVVCRE